MTFRSKLHGPAIGTAMIALVAALSISASAAGTYSAKAFSFVGTAAQCDPFPAGNRIITSSWLNGAGLPDNGTANPGGGYFPPRLVAEQEWPNIRLLGGGRHDRGLDHRNPELGSASTTD